MTGAQLRGGADFGPPAAMLILTSFEWAAAAHLETLGRSRNRDSPDSSRGTAIQRPSPVRTMACEQYHVRPVIRAIRSHDRILELDLPDIQVLSAAPAHWETAAVYEQLLDTAAAVLLMLNRIADLRRLNSDVITIVSQHVTRLGINPVVAANDPHGNNPSFPTVTAAEIARDLDPSWRVFETTIGPFEPTLRWSFGAGGACARATIGLTQSPPADVPSLSAFGGSFTVWYSAARTAERQTVSPK